MTDVHHRHIVPHLIDIVLRDFPVIPLLFGVIITGFALQYGKAAIRHTHKEINIGKHKRVKRMPEHNPHGKHLQAGFLRENLRYQILQSVSKFLGNPVGFRFLNHRGNADLVIVKITAGNKRRDSHDSGYITASDPQTAECEPLLSGEGTDIHDLFRFIIHL